MFNPNLFYLFCCSFILALGIGSSLVVCRVLVKYPVMCVCVCECVLVHMGVCLCMCMCACICVLSISFVFSVTYSKLKCLVLPKTHHLCKFLASIFILLITGNQNLGVHMFTATVDHYFDLLS